MYVTHIDDRPLINPVRQEVFGDAPGLDARRGAAPRGRRRQGRDRVRRARAGTHLVTTCDLPRNPRSPRAFVPCDNLSLGVGCATWTTSGTRSSRESSPRDGPLVGQDACRQGSHRHGRDSHHVRIRALREPRPGAERRGRAAPRRRGRGRRRQDAICPSSPGASSARASGTGRVGTRAPRSHDRRLFLGLGGGARGGLVRARARHRHGLLDPPAVRGL